VVSKRVPGFKPSQNAFHFGNDFDPGPVMTLPVPAIGDIPVGSAAGGLCGGMVFAVLDMFERGLAPPPAQDAPKPGSPLFRYIASRLLDSFNGVTGVFKYLEWMRLPSDARFFGLMKSIAWHSIHDEWPHIKKDLNNGQLCPLGLIKIESVNPFNLGENHQVLAYGYDFDENSGDLKIYVYDPNCENNDDVTIAVNIADMNNPSHVTYSADANGRGFFRTHYKPQDPSSALTTT
jgi:hypothetical protein